MPSLIGNKPNQVPTNGDLGRLAFMDNLDSFTSKTVMDTDITNIAPSLNLDFANSKVLDPRITFTRASTATFYNGISSAVAEQNLLLWSQDFTNAAWVGNATSITGNTTVAPDGTTTGCTLTANGTANPHYIKQTVSASPVGKTFSVYVKAGTNNFVQLYFDGDAAPWANFDLSAGTVGSVGSNQTASIVSVGSGWYRCIVATTSTTATLGAILIIASSTAPRAESNSLATTIILWGAQLEQRSAATAYTPTTTAAVTNYIPTLQTAAAGVARFDHNPITGESLGLLIEEQRTNLLTYSEGFSVSTFPWFKDGATITADTVIAPDGTLTSDKIVANATTARHIARQSQSTTALSTNTFSCYAKAGEYQFLALSGIFATNSNGFCSVFNLTNGTSSVVNNSASYPIVNTATAVGNGWYRCTVTVTNVSGVPIDTWIVSPSPTASPTIEVVFRAPSYLGDGWSGIYIWGAQLEAGSFATSYIPTVASQVTRSPDAASMTGTNFSSWFNISQGTFFTEFSYVSIAQYSYAIAGQDSSSSTRWVETGGGTGVWRTYDGNTLNFGTLPTNTNNKVAVTATQTVNTNCVNGGNINTGTATGNLLTKTVGLGIGSYNSSAFLNGRIKKLSYYPKALNNSELVEMTA